MKFVNKYCIKNIAINKFLNINGEWRDPLSWDIKLFDSKEDAEKEFIKDCTCEVLMIKRRADG